MPTYRMRIRWSNKAESEHDFSAPRLVDALALARLGMPSDTIVLLVRMVEEEVDLHVCCPHCHEQGTADVSWNGETSAIVTCPNCSRRLRVRREWDSEQLIKVEKRELAGSNICGAPPLECELHRAKPTRLDQLRLVFASPDTVAWNCLKCNWKIECVWIDRLRIHTCPYCSARQYIPSESFAWNSRMLFERERRVFAARAAEVRRQRREAEERESRLEELKAASERTRTARQRELEALADTAVSVGLVISRQQFLDLDSESIENVRAISQLADLLRDHLLTALDQAAMAAKGVALGRPAATGVSVLSFLNGYSWVGLAFGALAIGARSISEDWKRAKLAEYQAEWTAILAELDAEQLSLFARIFAFRYPALAAHAAALQGHVAGE